MKTIGIIGGAGPMASCQLYQSIIEECQKNYGCTADADFPRMIIINYPFADMLTVKAHEQNKLLLTKQLQTCFDQLAAQGAIVIAIACNTLHTLLPSIVIPHGCELVHIAHETLVRAHQLGIKRLLILATSTTAQLQLYRASNFDCLWPKQDDQLVVDQVIANILDGKIDEADTQQLAHIISRYPTEGVVLGCTELPLLHERYSLNLGTSIPILNTTRILATAVLKKTMDRHIFS